MSIRLLTTIGLVVLAMLFVDVEASRHSQCKIDSDCFPATCCHAAICAPASEREKGCKGGTCTKDCVPNTIDCGGKCRCNRQGLCVAVFGNVTAAGKGRSSRQNYIKQRMNNVQKPPRPTFSN